MPSMIRMPGKGKKIAWKILGVPPNIAFKPSDKQRKLNHALLFQETSRMR